MSEKELDKNTMKSTKGGSDTTSTDPRRAPSGDGSTSGGSTDGGDGTTSTDPRRDGSDGTV